MRINFISGLPRSGSTLLVALLAQNPAFKTGITLATLRVLQAIEVAASRDSEVSILLNDEQKLALRRAVFTAIHGDDPRCVVWDKNHLWTSKMPLLAALFPDAKVIACVRDMSWIMDSFERLYQSNPLETAAMFGFRAAMTVYGRVAKMAASDGVVGMPFDALREAYYGEHAHNLLLVEYTNLVTSPAVVMSSIYDFIGEPHFRHRFDNLSFSCDAFDAAVGMPGLHTIKPKVEFRPRKSVLPPDLFDRFSNDAFWTTKRLPVQGRREVG